MKSKIKSINKTILLVLSISTLIIPDIIISFKEDILTFSLIIISKISLFLFLFLLILKLTKSYFLSYLIIGSLYLISSVVEVINICILNNYITLDNIKALFHTSKSEINEFYDKFYLYFLIPIFIFISFIFILKKTKLYFYNKNNPIIKFSTISLLFSISISFFFIYNSPQFHSGKNLIKYTFKQYYIKQHPFNVFYRTYEFIISRSKFNKYKLKKENFKFNILNKTDSLKRPDVVILVIGERIRYSNWSINGYNKKTSPNLESIENLISFNRHHSNGNSTAGSIPFLITQATPENPEYAYSQKTIVSLFKETDYKTVWISNQNIFDYIENKNEPDDVIELYKKKGSDLKILPVFDSIIKTKGQNKRFIVINMVGGHGSIPKLFNKFRPNSFLKNYPLNFKNKSIFINDYDNMILLQDFVLSKIIKLTKSENLSSIILFTSDHGSNLFESDNLFGYGSANPTEKETHIPLFIWGSNKFIKNNYKYSNLIKNKNLLTTNDNLFYTLADLANIRYSSFLNNKSISDSLYIEPETRSVYTNGSYKSIKNTR
ncbi:phosphoethanolamine transferase [Polaribacter sp. IC073]|uniref:phosphoethanolamine transferase n=1 Tax=Polaribacter sp. IC073 TaxID=2508540 RepID=UPI0011BFC039|nr:phosphoethanolamine transferase [Polaribacter sp. IC073]TXD48442.1 phosphoethanolamine transferase [Polaribacter sp. IC073]